MITITESNYQQIVDENEKLVVQYTASWCGPCRQLTPRLVELADSMGFAYGKLDVDANPEAAREAGILSIPTMFVYKNGRLVERITGVKPKPVLTELFGNVLQ